MSIMVKSFSPSVNVVRDEAQELEYVVTQNASTVFKQIVNSYLSGTHCFNIVGAYGTGKSAFIWAFQQTLTKKHEYFQTEAGFKGTASFRFIHFTGHYASLKEEFARHFVASKPEKASSTTILSAIDQEYQSLAKNEFGLVLAIDEFGKFLEYAAKESPEAELYFIQELAEYINDPQRHIILLTTLHQDASAYAFELSPARRNEWEKVKGRLQELPFNEPVEQLLQLAAQQLSIRPRATTPAPKSNQQLFEAIKEAQVFPLRDYFTPEMQEQLWPLDLLSAALLVNSLRRYGQNERSLFGFLRSNDYLGIDEHVTNGTYYSVCYVYDYLSYHFYSLLTSRYNPDFAKWAIIRDTLDRIERLFEEEELIEARKLVKTIGLLSIFAPAGAEISLDFLNAYSRLSAGVKTTDSLIAKFEKEKLIRLVRHKNSYFLFEGTDLDIETAIEEAGASVEQVTDVASRLREFFTFPYVTAKQASYEVGTPRIFEFRITDEVLVDKPAGEIDGFINLIFSDSINEENIAGLVGPRREAILYGVYKRSGEVKNLIREIDKIRKVREANINDKIAVRELNDIYDHTVTELNRHVLDSLYKADGNIIWYFNGDASVNFKGSRAFNRCLSEIAQEIYPNTPVYRSEFVNKTKLTTPIVTARKNFIRAVFENWQKPDLGFPSKSFPPEKTIYLSFLKETGIHQSLNDEHTLTLPTNPTFHALWQASEDFLTQSQEGPLKISELMQTLLRKPIKVKQGFVDFWVPIFLFINRHEFALYGEQGRYIPEINPEVVDLFSKSPSQYTVRAFALRSDRLALFNEYRQLLQLAPALRTSNGSFIESIKPFLTLYRKLTPYAQQTRNLPKAALRLRESIATAKDPVATFFEKFPGALGFNLPELQSDAQIREKYVLALQDSISRIQQAFPKLLKRIEEFIGKEVLGKVLEFEEYKQRLQDRYKSLALNRAAPELRIFLERIMSKLDDRDAWLNSMANALMSKSFENFDDADEKTFRDRFLQRINDLDNLCELGDTVIDQEVEELFRVGIMNGDGREHTRIIRRPKNRNEKETDIENQVRTLLGGDKPRSLAILSRLLKEQL